MIRLHIWVVAALYVLAAGISAEASSITYTIITTESGTIGAKSFSNATVTATVTGNTSNIGSLGTVFFCISR